MKQTGKTHDIRQRSGANGDTESSVRSEGVVHDGVGSDGVRAEGAGTNDADSGERLDVEGADRCLDGVGEKVLPDGRDKDGIAFDGMPRYDAHIHMALDGDNWKQALSKHKDRPDENSIRRVLKDYAQAGYTYLRDGGDKYGVGKCAASIAHEYGIEYATPCFPIYQKGNYGSFISIGFETFDDYKVLVNKACDEGATFIKLMLSGVMDFNEFGAITGYSIRGELLEKMISYAHSKGKPVMAHINGALGIIEAIEAGVDSIEHGYFSDAPSREKLARSNTIWVPTIAPVNNLIGTGRYCDDILHRILSIQLESIFMVADSGGTIALGSDAGASCVYHVEAGMQEYDLLAEALGNNCAQIIKSGFKKIRERFPGKTRK